MPLGNSLDYIEVAEDFGLPVEKNRELAGELPSLDVSVGEDIIASIRLRIPAQLSDR